MTTLDESPLGRILKAVGRWPADRKPSDLWRQLVDAIHEYHWLCNLRPNVKAQQARLRAIHKCASKLAELLAVDEEKGGLLKGGVFKTALWPEDAPPPREIVTQVERVIEDSYWLKSSIHKIVDAVKAENRAGSAFEWLVGIRLKATFEDFFCDEAKAYNEGRYVRFALQVLKEFAISNNGRPYSATTIIRALTDARSDRRRSGQK
jgi:hypothetical protein